MSSGQATPPTSNYRLIIDALADYTQITGIDLASNPFAAAFELERSSSSEDILQLFQGREKAFKEYRDGDRRLINFLSPAVNVIQAFSGILADAVSLVSHTCKRCYQVDLINYRALDRFPFHRQVLCLRGLMSSLLCVLESLNCSLMIYKYSRLPAGLPPVTMPY